MGNFMGSLGFSGKQIFGVIWGEDRMGFGQDFWIFL